MSGQIKFLDWITRDMLRAEPDARFVFGDNTTREGLGGQAGAMRGEPNAIGIATKRYPGGRPADYFEDNNLGVINIVNEDIDKVVAALLEGRTVYLPRDGLGTGLSELPTRAPKLHRHIINRFRSLVADGADFPWGA